MEMIMKRKGSDCECVYERVKMKCKSVKSCQEEETDACYEGDTKIPRYHEYGVGSNMGMDGAGINENYD
jgi:hypothetical protein